MRTLPLILCLFLFTGTVARAQNCFLYYIKGDVGIRTGKKVVSARKGDSFSSGQSLVIQEGTLASILNDKGLLVDFGKKGIYPYEKVQIELAKSTQKTGKYLSYIWKQFNSHHGSEDKNSMRASGGIHRGDDAILTEPYDSAVLLDAGVRFAWQNAALPSTFTLYDKSNIILKFTVNDSSLVLYPHSSGLVRGKYYTWSVADDPFQTGSSKYSFILPDKTWMESYSTEEAELKKTLSGLNDPAFAEAELQRFRKSKKIIKQP